MAADVYYYVYSAGSSLPTEKVKLKQGDVWKYGETTSYERYSVNELKKEGVYLYPEFAGTQAEIKVMENIRFTPMPSPMVVFLRGIKYLDNEICNHTRSIWPSSRKWTAKISSVYVRNPGRLSG